MKEEEFLLKWNNHQSNFIDVFRELLCNDSFVDVTLVCGGQPISGHKVVLAACSPLLHRILHENPCKHPVIILSDVKARDMKSIMRFIYQGEVSVSQSELASFLRTADNLQIKGLAEDKHCFKEEKKRKECSSSFRDGEKANKKTKLIENNNNGGIILSSKPKDSHNSSQKGRNRINNVQNSSLVMSNIVVPAQSLTKTLQLTNPCTDEVGDEDAYSSNIHNNGEDNYKANGTDNAVSNF